MLPPQVHKLLKLQIKPGQESELCHMIIDCCAQQRTYEKFFGLMGQRFCQVRVLLSSFWYHHQILCTICTLLQLFPPR